MAIKFNKGWEDAIISAHEIYYITSIRNKPIVQRVNPMNFFYIKSKDSEWIQDSEACVHERVLNLYEVYDEFGHEMTEEDRLKLDEILSGKSLTSQGLTAIDALGIKMIADINTMELVASNISYEDVPIKNLKFRVAHIVWKSMTDFEIIS